MQITNNKFYMYFHVDNITMAKDLRREAGRIKHMVKQEQRYCKIQEDFVLTDLFRRPITEKFYSRATQISETDSLAKLVEKHLITIKGWYKNG